jgi:diguanylate cyclase (GGDEF)-like protein
VEGAIEQATARQAEQKAAQSPAAETPASEAASSPASPPLSTKVDEERIESCLLQLNAAMARSESKATEIDIRLRDCQGPYEAASVGECLASFQASCREYMQEHTQLFERFRTRASELGKLQPLKQEIEGANAELATQVQTTLDSLEKLDPQADPRVAAERLLEEIDQLRGTRHRLRDEHEAAYVSLARAEGRLLETASELQHDPLTGMNNRIGLEVQLAKWWAEGKLQTETLAIATIDLDHFASLNAEQGATVGDHILVQVGQWVTEKAGEQSVVARLGQRFVAVLAGRDLTTLGPTVESARQALARSSFVHNNQTISVTASGALTVALPADTPVSLLERLEQTLTAAKASGRNRLFVDGEQGPKILEGNEVEVSGQTVSV